MARTSVIIFSICLASLGAVGVGCVHQKEDKHPAQKVLSKSDYQAIRQEFSEPTGGKTQFHSYPVRQGKPPLAVLVPAGNAVRVINAATGALIAVGETERDAIVSVDASAGVTLGQSRLAPGPIPSAGDIAIYIEQPRPVMPGAAPAPAAPRNSATTTPAK